jgi:dienelactone hydrolase
VRLIARWRPIGTAALGLAIAAARLAADLSGTTPADRRADFLRLIDRPRVPAAFAAQPAAEQSGLERTNFSYASDTADRVPGILLRRAPPPGPGTDRRPVVIVLHGTGGTKEGELPMLTDLAQAGFIAIAIDAPYHGARSASGKGSADYVAAILRTYRTGQGHPFFYDTVWDVMRLIDCVIVRADVDPQRIGLFGVSKGGIETYLAAAVDPRVAVAVPCIGVESFRWADDHDSWHSRIGTVQAAFDAAARDDGLAAPGAEFVHRFYARIAPGIEGEFDGPAMVPLIAPRPLLAVNGDSDPRTPQPGLMECVAAARQAYLTAGAGDAFGFDLQPHTGHKVTPEGTRAALAWFVRWLRP